MNPELDESLIRDLAEPLVEQLSPAESGELFALLSEAHFAAPEAYAHQTGRPGPLAFGLPELTVLMTPVLLAAATEVVKYVARAAAASGAKPTSRLIRRMFGLGRKPGDAATSGEPPAQQPSGAQPPGADEQPLVLTAAQWAEIRDIVEQVALRGGADASQAQLVADAVVGRAALTGGIG